MEFKKRLTAPLRTGKRLTAPLRTGKRLTAPLRTGKRLTAPLRTGKRLTAPTLQAGFDEVAERGDGDEVPHVEVAVLDDDAERLLEPDHEF